MQLPGKRKAVAANISLLIQNEYTIKANVPPLAFDILLPNCVPGEEYILLGNATSDRISIEPKKPVTASLTGYIHQVPDTLTAICPGKTTSPLDHVLQRYMKGLDTIVYVRGGSLPSSYPEWLEDLLRSVTVPIAVPSKGLSNLIRRFSMSHVQFYLPEPLAEPDTPEAQPRVSALVEALVDLPEEMNVSVNVSRVRTVADVYYHDKKLGYIDLQKWQAANAKRIGDGAERKPVLLVEFDIKKAPLQITDEALFTEVLKKVIFDQGSATLEVKGEVTAELDTALGQFRIRGIPANGNIVVKGEPWS